MEGQLKGYSCDHVKVLTVVGWWLWRWPEGETDFKTELTVSADG